MDIAGTGIMSDDTDAGGLQVPDSEAADIDGDSEYWRPSTGNWRGADMGMIELVPEDIDPYNCDFNASFSLLSSSF